jgi:BlaI family transcriptional regulator, penicillinase repressor
MKPIFQPFWFSSRRLGPLEQRILDGLWEKGNSTVRELLERDYPELAYTTLMTTLDRLFKKGLLTRTEEGRAFRYAPRMSREELHREAASHAFYQLLEASPASALPLSFLVEMVSERDKQLLDELGNLVERKRRELNEREKRKRSGKVKEQV